jgi:hypothetical protein
MELDRDSLAVASFVERELKLDSAALGDEYF